MGLVVEGGKKENFLWSFAYRIDIMDGRQFVLVMSYCDLADAGIKL